MTSTPREKELVDTFVELADTMVNGYDIVDLLYRLVTRCAQILGAADAGILIPDSHGSLEVVASTSERGQLISLLQLNEAQGPCLEAYHSGQPVTVDDFDAIRHRWPRFAEAAGEQGYTWMHAIPLRLRDEVIGSLNLFGDQPGALTAEDALAARGLADIATIGILHERAFQEMHLARTQLQHALDSRIVIEQAKGILSHTHGVDMEEAFRLLRDRARSTQRKLADVSREIIADASGR
ncbi:GAF and ANTAR domain-containing protein [uncultured Microbacterium sp.]|uniref:GAF and ANTAR domain-containing protein n=1 Tax=uncultured Microbacterium sp. TaxID=191216 RepID=UPI0028D1468B|nr:GAF and ANTAR domain-containing protein [uncultured Microbacterium sp.]